MNALSLMALAHHYQVRITLEEGKLILKGEKLAVQSIMTIIQNHRAVLADYFSQYQHRVTYQAMYEERAAQYEYEAIMPRAEAEKLAYQETLVAYIKNLHPLVRAEFEQIIFQPFLH